MLDYRAERDMVRAELTTAVIAYYCSRLENLSPKELWHELRKLGLLKTTCPPPLAVSPDELNRAVAQVSTAATNVEPTTELLAEDGHIVPSTPPDGVSTLKLEPVIAREVSATINSLKSYAMGADGINARMLKSLLGLLLTFLVALFNLSLSNCWFPAAWKRAIIVPIAKISAPKTIALSLCFLRSARYLNDLSLGRSMVSLSSTLC